MKLADESAGSGKPAAKAMLKAKSGKDIGELFSEGKNAAPPPVPEIPLQKPVPAKGGPQADAPPAQANQAEPPPVQGRGKKRGKAGYDYGAKDKPHGDPFDFGTVQK